MNKKKLLLIIGTVLLILLIILLRPRHIKLSLSDTDDLSVVREGSEISLTQNIFMSGNRIFITEKSIPSSFMA